MATYPADYTYVTNAGPPVQGATEDDLLRGGRHVPDPNESAKRGRPTIDDSKLSRSGFLANLGSLKTDKFNYDEEAMKKDPHRFAFGTAYGSSADTKVTDHRVGGSYGVGGAPAFTRYSDVRSKGLMKNRNDVTLTNTTGELGMGRIASETMDDVQELLYLQFGFPMFNSLMGYLTTFSDAALTKLATTGKGESFMYDASFATGMVMAARALNPLVATIALTTYALGKLMRMRTSRFYTLNQQMGLYWSTVNTLVNQLAINRGIIPRVNLDSKEELAQQDELLTSLEEMMPGMFNRHSGIDVPAIISIPTRRVKSAVKETAGLTKNQIRVRDTAEATGAELFIDYTDDNIDTINAAYNAINYEINDGSAVDGDGLRRGSLEKMLKISGQHDWNLSPDTSKPGTDNDALAKKPQEMIGAEKYINRDKEEFESVAFDHVLRSKAAVAAENGQTPVRAKIDGDVLTNSVRIASEDRNNADGAGFFDTAIAYAQEGVEWAIFRVQHIQSVSESFNNSTSGNSLGSGLNAVASTARNVKFSFAGGNLGDNMIMEGIESVVSGITDVAANFIDGYTFGLAGSIIDILRGVNVEIPAYWESADATISTTSFTLDLVSPYNNVMSDIQNLYIPACMIFAGMLPIKSGSQSHVSPFLCRSHLLGKNKTELSMIESVTITRGHTHLPFDSHGHARGMKIEFTLVNLSPSMSAPLSVGNPLRPANYVLDQDSSIYEYMQMLGGMTLEEQSLSVKGLQVRFAGAVRTISRLTDPTAWAAMTHHYVPQMPVVGIAYRAIGGASSNMALLRGEQSR